MGGIFKREFEESRIGECKNQMKLFKFYFSLNLSQGLHVITDNLLLTLLFKHWKTLGMSMILACYTKKIKVSASKIEAISPIYYVTLQETKRQQRQRIIWNIPMNITNRFITKLLILLLTSSKIDSFNQHLSCSLKQSSCF